MQHTLREKQAAGTDAACLDDVNRHGFKTELWIGFKMATSQNSASPTASRVAVPVRIHQSPSSFAVGPLSGLRRNMTHE